MLENYIRLKQYSLDNRMDYNVIYNKIKGKDVDIIKIHNRSYLYNIKDLDRILKNNDK